MLKKARSLLLFPLLHVLVYALLIGFFATGIWHWETLQLQHTETAPLIASIQLVFYLILLLLCNYLLVLVSAGFISALVCHFKGEHATIQIGLYYAWRAAQPLFWWTLFRTTIVPFFARWRRVRDMIIPVLTLEKRTFRHSLKRASDLSSQRVKPTATPILPSSWFFLLARLIAISPVFFAYYSKMQGAKTMGVVLSSILLGIISAIRFSLQNTYRATLYTQASLTKHPN